MNTNYPAFPQPLVISESMQVYTTAGEYPCEAGFTKLEAASLKILAGFGDCTNHETSYLVEISIARAQEMFKQLENIK